VLRDVQALSEMGVPVIAREGPGGGYSLDPDYRTEPLPLTRNEAFLLLLAIDAVQQLSDLPFQQELSSLTAKLRALLPQGEPTAGAQDLLANIGLQVPTREQKAPFLEALLQAAQAHAWLRVVYRSAERTTTQHLLPGQIYAQDGFWYCTAYSHERGERRTYRVDRIQHIEPPAAGFSPAPVAEGLPYDHPSHPEVRARLTPRGADLVETEAHLAAALRRLEDRSGEISLRCPPSELDWYARYFASLGAQVEVLAPPELCQKLENLGRELLERYQKR